MKVGDIVIVHIERNVSAQIITPWVQEVLAINPAGDITHTCSIGKSAKAIPNEENSLKYKHIVEIEPMNEYEQEAVRDFLDIGLTDGPLDEIISKTHTLTRLGLIKAIANHRESHRGIG